MKNLGGGAARLRQINREIVKDALMVKGKLTKAGLAERTGLSLATCANVVADLLNEAEILELDERKTMGGRPARVYAINPEHSLAAVVVAEMVGGRSILSHAVADSLGNIVEQNGGEEGATPELIERLVGRLKGEHPAIRAIGVSIPGLVSGGVVDSCDIEALAGFDLERVLSRRYGIKALVDNDMNLAAAGYYRSRRDLDTSGLAYLAFPSDNCPGAGIIVEGRVVKGMSNFAGEVASLPLTSAGEKTWLLRDGPLHEYIAKVLTTIVALINPSVVVVTGDLVEGLDAGVILDLCGRRLPQRHLPELIVKPDCSDDRLRGAVGMAMASLACPVRMVRKERNWCDDE